MISKALILAAVSVGYLMFGPTGLQTEDLIHVDDGDLNPQPLPPIAEG